MDFLQLTGEIPIGKDGVDKSISNPLHRALRKLLEQGSPFKRISMCFFSNDSINAHELTYYWFGIFLISVANRLLFFPGFSLSGPITIERGISRSDQLKLQLDHLSLEENLESWHITGMNEEHQGGFLTHDIGADRKLWFGTTLASVGSLLPLRKTTEVLSETPANDSRRRMMVFMKARHRAKFQILHLPEPIEENADNSSYHFAVIVSPAKSPIYKGSDLLIPFTSHQFTDPLPNPIQRKPVRTHIIRLDRATKVQITTLVLPRKLQVPVLFTNRIR